MSKQIVAILLSAVLALAAAACAEVRESGGEEEPRVKAGVSRGRSSWQWFRKPSASTSGSKCASGPSARPISPRDRWTSRGTALPPRPT